MSNMETNTEATPEATPEVNPEPTPEVNPEANPEPAPEVNPEANAEPDLPPGLNPIDLDDYSANDLIRIQFSTTQEEMREIAARICRNYLHGAWKLVNPEHLEFRRLDGGLSNYLYYMALPDDVSMVNAQLSMCERPGSGPRTLLNKISTMRNPEPKRVLLRIHGRKFGTRSTDSVVTQSVIFTLLSERQLGPKLLGVFSGGRIEEYIPGRALLTRELANPVYSQKIAQNLAIIHKINVPISKEPSWVWTQMNDWLSDSKHFLTEENIQTKPDDVQLVLRNLRNIDYETEIEWLKTYILKVDSPVVFCHNDLQEGNILLLEKIIDPAPSTDRARRKVTEKVVPTSPTNEEPKLVLIDYEYCAYNYRGFDIANHFQEWVYEYTNQERPFFNVLLENAPTVEQREYFVREYLIHFHKDTGYNYQHADFCRIDEEVDVFTLVTHLFWSLWAISNGHTSHIQFGYWEFAMERYECYVQMKNQIFTKVRR